MSATTTRRILTEMIASIVFTSVVREVIESRKSETYPTSSSKGHVSENAGE